MCDQRPNVVSERFDDMGCARKKTLRTFADLMFAFYDAAGATDGQEYYYGCIRIRAWVRLRIV